jgi:hypothetical protein
MERYETQNNSVSAVVLIVSTFAAPFSEISSSHVDFFSRIRKRFIYHCIKKNSLNIQTMHLYRAPKKVNLK